MGSLTGSKPRRRKKSSIPWARAAQVIRTQGASARLAPLGVFLQVGLGKHFWINILLTLLGYIPGVVHAVWVIAKY
ncbi:MAG TPA: YqaE/Pmp3 family membrane protein [Rubrobacteraceae bacterium]|nr:YqaE/Pmp3 family membrane protein [Rubrobacteraceae bacterium]